jgi:hypothetical protein
LGINDISNNTYGLTDLQRFIPKLLVKLQLHFSTGWNNAIGSFGAGTNGDDFYTRYIHIHEYKSYGIYNS